MAIYHLSTKPISRSSGRSAVASIAYRAGVEIADERLGKTYDYTKRSGVLWTGMATPKGLEIDRSALWNLAEKTETRSNSRTAREIIINIPHELMQGDQSAGKMLAYEFATNLSQKYQIAVDVAIHAPDKQGDNRNYHAHLLLTTRQIEQQDGRFELGKKSQLEMSNAQLKQAGLLSNQDELKQIRKEWAELANEYLAEHGLDERIDHRSHKDRGLLTLPTVKMGWQATELERQGIKTDVGDQNRAIRAYNAQIEQQNNLRKQLKQQQVQNCTKNEQKSAEKSPILPRYEKTTTTHNPNTFKNTPTIAHNQHKIKNGTQVPPNPKKSLKTQNRAFSENPILSPEQHQQILAFLQKFKERIEQTAKQIWQSQLKTLQNQAKPILASFENLRDNKPLLFGKDKWQQDKQQVLDAYNAIKLEHDTKRDKGITDEHRKQANQQLKHDEPELHAKAQAYMISLANHEHSLKQKQAQSMGADDYAKPNGRYSGKIIQSNNQGILQQTQNGIIYHRLTSLDVGKSYTIEYNQDASEVSYREDYDLSRWTKNKNYNIER